MGGPTKRSVKQNWLREAKIIGEFLSMPLLTLNNTTNLTSCLLQVVDKTVAILNEAALTP